MCAAGAARTSLTLRRCRTAAVWPLPFGVRVPLYAGIDWAAGHHDLAVVDQHGTLLAQQRVTADPAGVRAILDTLRTARRGRPRTIVTVGIETADGLLVAALRHHGQRVVVLPPMLVARQRGAATVHRVKSDRSDARLIAELVRAGKCGRPLPADTPLALAIGHCAAAHQSAIVERARLAHRLHSTLTMYHPAAATAWAGRDLGLAHPHARAVLAATLTPELARRITAARIDMILHQAGRTRLIRQESDRLHAILTTTHLRQPALVEAAYAATAGDLLTLIDAAHHAVTHLAGRLTALVDTHPQQTIYRSLPGCGPLTTARLLAALGDDPHRFPTSKALRAYAGAAPITWASGTSTTVRVRRHSALNALGHQWAFNATQFSPGCRALYDRRRAAGDRHATALRRVFGKLLNQLHTCLRTDTHYDQNRAWSSP